MSVTLTFAWRDVTLEDVSTGFLKAFGLAVRQLRQERGMTQAELAKRLDLGRTSITNLEKGQQSPPLSMLPDIARALGIDPLRLIADALRGDEGKRPDVLGGKVLDEDLRRWADQVIGDSLSSQSPDAHSQGIRQRRPA